MLASHTWSTFNVLFQYLAAYRDNGYGREDDERLGGGRRETFANPQTENGGFSGRKVPISLEDLKKMKEAQASEQSKPVFLTKAQRRALALKEREAEVAAQRSQESASHSSFSDSRYSSSGNRGGDANRERDRRSENSNYDFPSYGERPPMSKQEQMERDRELDLIRKEKLGMIEVKKRKVPKGSDRILTKPTYWEDTEDTGAQEISSIYKHRSEALPQFGRGSLAGMDTDDLDFESSSHSRPGQSDSHHRDTHYSRGRDSGDAKGRSNGSTSKTTYSWESKPLNEMTTRDWRILREDFSITVKGNGVPNPMRSWSESNLPDWALRAIKDAKYTEPTPIQRQAIPIGLEGRDMIGIAETGSGKTASFLLPLLVHISKLPRSKSSITESEGPYACILAPTRELAMQIKIEADKFSMHANCRTVLLIGGEDIQGQVSELRKGCEIIVATTGRLCDLLNNAWLVLSQCNYVVLDEGDRMIDMGFEDQVLQILDAMPAAKDDPSKDRFQNVLRTTVLFSATMPPPVERIANKYLRNPVTINVGDVGKAVDRIKQVIEFCKSDNDKRRRLQELLIHGPKPPIIIFMNHKASCDATAKFVEKFGFSTAVLHSGKSQEARDWAITEFKEHRVEILIATNVAGRGLDVRGVTHVINYDLPKSIDEYVHRIGRTGRAGMNGLATSFLTQDDDTIAASLKQLLTKTNNKVPRELNDMISQSSVRPVY